MVMKFIEQAKKQEKKLAIISADRNKTELTFTVHCGPKRHILHSTSDVTEAIRESLKVSEVKDMSVGSGEPPSKDWKMVQVWVKCPKMT